MTSTEFDAMLERSVRSFGAAAAEEGLVGIAVRVVASPVGQLLIAASAAGIVRVGFDVEDHDLVLEQLATVSPLVVEHDSRHVLDAAAQLEEYFDGARATFDVPVDLTLAAGPFRREVLLALRDIPLGQTRTYAQVAAATGRPSAIRAVGSGCATNPVPIVVPCHRVLRTGGALGGYLGGTDRKQWLLKLEQRVAS